MIDKACGSLRDQNVSDPFAIKLREGLKINAVDRGVSEFAFEFAEDGFGFAEERMHIEFRAIGIPKPCEAPDDLNVSRVRVFRDVTGIDGQKIVPDDDTVHFERHHIVEITLIIVDHVSPSPESARLDSRR